MRGVTKHSIVFLAMAAVGTLTLACGGHDAAMPTAPSSSAAAMPGAGAVTGATISGTVLGQGASLTTARVHTLGVPLTVTVTGTTTAAAVDGSGHFTLVNVPAGHVDLHFTGAGTDAHLALDGVMDHAAITITVVVSGTSASLDTGQRDDPDNTVEIEGLVTSTSASTITVNGRMITVDAATVIVHGDTTIPFANIRSGDRVHVKGAPTTAGGLSAVLATKIEVQNTGAPPTSAPPTTAPPSGGEDDGEAEVSGTLAAKSGTCPAISFKVGSTSVTTSASTQFKGAACAALANGTKVEVKGTKQTSGVVLASEVQADK